MSQSKARANLWKGINGATGVQVLTAGGTLGTGNIAFTANPTAGDTMTIGGEVFTFTSTASTATNINIKGTLALTLAEAETVIEANTKATTTGGLNNVDVTDIDTDLSFTFKPGYVAQAVSSTDGANTTDSAETNGTAAPLIDINKTAVYLEWADAGSTLGIINLPDGKVIGQMIEVYSVSEATVGDTIEIYGTFAGSKDRATIAGAAGDGATFYWSGTAWKITKATNTAIDATVQSAQAL